MATRQLKPRTELHQFMYVVERVLRRNDDKGNSWKSASFEYLFKKLLEEVTELYGAYRHGENVALEAADLSAICMMISHNFDSTGIVKAVTGTEEEFEKERPDDTI